MNFFSSKSRSRSSPSDLVRTIRENIIKLDGVSLTGGGSVTPNGVVVAGGGGVGAGRGAGSGSGSGMNAGAGGAGGVESKKVSLMMRL